jgi:hypothetical protein
MATAAKLVESPSVLPDSAIIYAIKALARRAGVTWDFFASWQFNFDNPQFVTVHIHPGTEKHIRFPRSGDQFWKKVKSDAFETTTGHWMRNPGTIAELTPNFKIPFSSVRQDDIGQLFVSAEDDSIECTLDLPASVLLTLSRFEETLEKPRDAHGRFPAFASIAWREGFLHRPIVDEYGLAFAQAIATLLPRWEPEPQPLRVNLGYDVDDIGLPFSFRSSLAHFLRRGNPLATVRDILARASGIDTSYQLLLRKLVSLSLDRGLRPSIYWKSARCGPYDTGYDPREPRIASMIATYRMLGIEMGIHPSYESFDSHDQFAREVGELRLILGEKRLGGRQDYLRWEPGTWMEWESLGLAYDASVGYADHVGFRAGTCHPYRPWLLSEEREADLLEIPLMAMDVTLLGYMKLTPDEALAKLRDCIARCRAVGGVFSLLWHNTTIMSARYARLFRTVLDDLSGCPSYDCRAADNDDRG